MAYRTRNMSNHSLIQEPTAERAALRCVILNAFMLPRTPNRRVPDHSHPFWQIEMLLKGKGGMQIGTDDETFTLRSRETIVLPPGVRHRLAHPAHGSYTATFKFVVHGLPGRFTPRVLPCSTYTETLQNAVCGVLQEGAIPSALDRAILEHLLCGFLHVYVSATGPAAETGAGHPLVAAVKRRVAALHGKPITIRALSKILGYSVGHLSVQFHKHEGVTLKAWLDRQRAEVAAHLLHYADLTISEIAYHMEFPDPFAFSRFCRRMLGKSPRKYRNESAKMPTATEAGSRKSEIASPEEISPKTR